MPWDVISDTKYTELKNKVFNEQASKQEKIELFEYCYASRYLALNMLFYPMIYTTF